jgi:hypothetical protein
MVGGWCQIGMLKEKHVSFSVFTSYPFGRIRVNTSTAGFTEQTPTPNELLAGRAGGFVWRKNYRLYTAIAMGSR